MTDIQAADSPPKRIWIDLLLLAALLAFTAAVLIVKGTERFEFFDMSAFLDGGYRVSVGQQPYVDFYYITGPVHLYMHALSFLVFGFTKNAVLTHLCVVGLAVTAAVFAIGRRHLGRVPSVLLALLTIFSFYGPICHPWYDHNAAFFLIVGIVLWEFFWSSSPPVIAVVCGLLAGLSFLTKSNVGLAGGILLFSLIATQPRPFKHLMIYVAGGVLSLVLAAAFLKSPEAYIHQAFFAYAPGTRLLNFDRLYEAVTEGFHLRIACMAVLLPLMGGLAWTRANFSRLILLAALVFVSIFTRWTGSMDMRGNTVWLSMQLLYLFVLGRTLTFARFGAAARIVKFAAVAALFVTIYSCLKVSIARTRELTIWTWNANVTVGDYQLQTPAFAGWHCNGNTGRPLDKVVEYINDQIPAGDSMLVFPDVTMIYGLTGRDPYRKVPFIFQVNQIATGRWYDECREHIQAEPPQWIVLHFAPDCTIDHIRADNILQWLKLEEFVNEHYGVVWRDGEFRVLRFGEGDRSATPLLN